MDRKPLGIGLYGSNGHQISHLLTKNPRAMLVAAACIEPDRLIRQAGAGTTEPGTAEPGVRLYDSLEALLGDERVDLVSLCSPRRSNQAAETIRCLYAGKHVYAEKPCAMREDELDDVLAAAQENGLIFHEMAGTAFEEPYATVMDVVRTGRLGPVVQVFAQKSYPWHEGRPQDESVDGGLILQCSIHAVRLVEHVCGLTIADVEAIETSLGDPDPAGKLRMAAILMLRLKSGGVAAVTANYLNQAEFGLWGHEDLRIFGTLGFVETKEKGQWIDMVIRGEGSRRLAPAGGRRNYFEMILDEILEGIPMPLTLNEELHPTRIVIRARQSAHAHEHRHNHR